jgi:protein-tyrosine phosphatase
MDDGPGDAAASREMLEMWRNQGVERIAASPHYVPHREPAKEFLARRAAAFKAVEGACGPSILLGAEVRIEKGVCETEGLNGLALAGGKHILLELPYSPFKEWMLAEAYGVMHNFGLVPIFAHIDRYLSWYTRDDMARVLSMREAVLQINNDALFKMGTRKFAVGLIRGGFPIVFGSDAHNTADRPPNNKAAMKALRAKLKEPEYLALIEQDAKVIGGL